MSEELTMRQRLTINHTGDLEDRRGRILGRIVSLTLDMDDGTLGGRGGAVNSSHLAYDDPRSKDDPQQTLLPDEGSPREKPKLEREIAETAWAHYERVIPGGTRYRLDNKRRRIIENALKVRSIEIVLKAIDGLAASPFHNGQNDRGKKYLGIQYALKGIGNESDDERIDKMAALAGDRVSTVLASVPSAGREMVRSRQNLVKEMLLHPEDANRRARAEGSAEYLREHFGLVAEVRDGAVVWQPVA